MKIGNIVVWKHYYEMNLPNEIGLTIEKFTPPGDLFPHWKVVFPRGILRCRECDLMEVP